MLGGSSLLEELRSLNLWPKKHSVKRFGSSSTKCQLLEGRFKDPCSLLHAYPLGCCTPLKKFFFGYTALPAGLGFPDQRSNLHHRLQWKLGVITTQPPAKSLHAFNLLESLRMSVLCPNVSGSQLSSGYTGANRVQTTILSCLDHGRQPPVWFQLPLRSYLICSLPVGI